ncbi:fructosyl amino acid oxidasesarcosine [Grosmannia clavigera kw1407]|uniref:Fructosyl amino acid oxidasesarcosine n=1 Tax=Grosmannia clavigera (strain kw1407 / UAMH 11150) TaxID=655863 RepID=F0XCA5_GROCL|nr:fructosyl amino acid oxidasesarcosine [Grosmannia clavigera kw1407]EFX03926.1 fructosyl amino acid oxidasesarcosine [Grosmannia clavigera kw1407]
MSFTPPRSILIIGSGVFGLSTADALTRRPDFAHTTITVVDRGSGWLADGDVANDDDDDRHFPARDAASIDSSRIIRPDYADPAYAALANEAQALWRTPVDTSQDYIGGDGRYSESGLVVIADADVDGHEKLPGQKKTGLDYVRESWANVRAMAQTDSYLAERLKLLPDPEAIRAAVGTGGTTGSWGYLNGASGWANAEASMAWMLKRVRQTGRVHFVRGRVISLCKEMTSTTTTVTGVALDDGRTLTADLVVVAAGAWTEALLDGAPSSSSSSLSSSPSGLVGSLAATGQVLGYVPLAADEHVRIATMPVVLNLSSGLFVIPPAADSHVLKVARHGYGYINPVPSSSAPSSVLSVPFTTQDDPDLQIPKEGADDLRRGLHDIIPLPGLASRPFGRTRICWYTDTPTADFLIDYHPHWNGLFFATGGSGHGFKFLPVLGPKIVDCIARCPPEAFRQKWAWKHRQTTVVEPEQDAGKDTTAFWKAVVCHDGSRGGQPGLILQEELAKASLP